MVALWRVGYRWLLRWRGRWKRNLAGLHGVRVDYLSHLDSYDERKRAYGFVDGYEVCSETSMSTLRK